jgi:hypothetical protein
MNNLCKVVMLGTNIPFSVDETSSIELGSGVVVPMPTLSFCPKLNNGNTDRRKRR